MLYVASALLLALLTFNFVATRTVLTLDYTREQKLLQLALVWIVPFIGACLVLAVAHVQHSEAPIEASDDAGEESDDTGEEGVPGPFVEPGD